MANSEVEKTAGRNLKYEASSGDFWSVYLCKIYTCKNIHIALCIKYLKKYIEMYKYKTAYIFIYYY